jgi:hypothetical protein
MLEIKILNKEHTVQQQPAKCVLFVSQPWFFVLTNVSENIFMYTIGLYQDASLAGCVFTGSSSL